MNRDKRVAFRVNEEEKATIAAIAKKLGRNESESMRVMIAEFGKALGVIPSTNGKAILRIKAETVGELPY